MTASTTTSFLTALCISMGLAISHGATEDAVDDACMLQTPSNSSTLLMVNASSGLEVDELFAGELGAPSPPLTLALLKQAVSQDTIWEQVSVGTDFACGLTSIRSIACWGDDSHGQVSGTPQGNDFVLIGSGHRANCALKSNGQAVCWGDDSYGVVRFTPSHDQFTWVGAGNAAACGIKIDGTVECWGHDMCVGRNDCSGHHFDVPDVMFKNMNMQADHMCGLQANGKYEAWGWDKFKQVSDTPPADANRFIQASCGVASSCGMTGEGKVICWGYSKYGTAPLDAGFIQVAAGGYFNCALQGTGVVKCWGLSGYVASTPTSAIFKSVAAAVQNACAVTVAGGIKCWGKSNGVLQVPVR